MNDYDVQRYDAFFDELGQIEKRAMLEKAASLGWVGGGLRGLKHLVTRSPAKNLSSLRKAWKTGIRRSGGLRAGQHGPPKPMTWHEKAVSGLEGVARVPVGKAAILGAGALGVAGVGAAGGAVGQAVGSRRE